MKRHNRNRKQSVQLSAVARDRRGSTLLIVLALLGLLTLMGLIFFTFANQERLSAEYFTEAAKNEPETSDDGHEEAIEQILMGAGRNRRNSALFGRAGILSNLVGSDSRPNSGTGINIIYWDDPNQAGDQLIPVVDQNRDGLPDHGTTWPDLNASTRQLINMMDSSVAHYGQYRDPAALPAPDNGVTYPDQNSPFLSYKGFAYRLWQRPNPAGGPPIQEVSLLPVIIPSYMRPGLLREGSENSATAPNWFNDVGADGLPGTPDDPYRATNFRPHRSHVFLKRDGTMVDDGTGKPVRRFIDAGNPEDAAALGQLVSGGWPFTPVVNDAFPIGDPNRHDRDGDGVFGELGFLTATPDQLNEDLDGDGIPEFDPYVYELDVDTDGDGILDAIWLDIDYPVLEDSANPGRKYTYMVAVSISDLEALLNLNVVGNLNGDKTTFNPVGGVDASLGGRTGMLSKSNGGITPAEINPLWALMRDPAVAATPATTFAQHQFFYGRMPANAYELANMEWLWLLMGRPELSAGPMPVSQSDISDLIAGRFGEPTRLYDAVTNSANLADFFLRAPRPGLALQDDNSDVLEGVPGYGMRGLTNPMDFNGTGRWVAADPRIPLLRSVVEQTNGLMTPVQAQQFLGYSLFSRTSTLANVPLGPNQLHYRGEDGVWGTADDLVTLPQFNSLYDDMNEMMVEPERIERPFDEPYTNAEALTLQLSDAHRNLAGDKLSDRVLNLAPFAFAREDIRQRFTTANWSLREHSISVPFPPGVVTPFGRDGAPGWAGVDDDGDGNADRNPDGSWDMDEVGMFDRNDANPVRRRSEDGFRAWMISADTALFDSANNGALVANGRAEFPPRFGQSRPFSSREFGIADAPVTNNLRASRAASGKISEDPFRPQLRRLLRLEAGDRRGTFGQLPLNINRFLDVERLPNRGADLLRGILEYRALTEHVDSRNSDGSVATPTLTNSTVTPCPYPPNDLTGNNDGSVIDEMEYWARRDRQKMARDIYVLLYTLGGGNDTVNYTGSNLTVTPNAVPTSAPTSGNYNVYTPAQLRQMAQFAVNLVDALDRDNVATKFEYDKNLGDTLSDTGGILYSGWNLDDNASTRDAFGPIPNTFAQTDPANGLIGGFDGNYPEDSFERGVVYGVEKQALAFSEVLAVRTREMNDDHPATLFEDDAQAYGFLHVELQNMSTEDVPLATAQSTNDQTAIYRLRRFSSSTNNAVPDNYILNRNNQSTVALLRDAPVAEAGRPYTITTSDGNDRDPITGENRPSDLYVDYDTDGAFDRISPAIDLGLPTGMSTPTDPALQPRGDVDLVHQRDRDPANMVFSVNGKGPGADTAGDFLTELRGGETLPVFDPNNSNATLDHVLVLERRANPHMPSLPLSENPWVEVDRTYVRFNQLNIQESDTAMELPGRLQNLWSVHRMEPLQAISNPGTPNDGTSVRFATNVAGRRNTIGQPNTDGIVGKTAYRLVQPHYDRDFTSLGDLLHLPLFGPDSLTSQLQDSLDVPSTNGNGQVAGATLNTWNGTVSLPATPAAGANPPVPSYGRGRAFNQALVSGANAKFLMADFPSTVATNGQDEFDLDNRWYAMFGVLEVLSRTHKQLGNPLVNLKRVPGKINLNTLRDPQVLMALLDSPLVADLDVGVAGTLRENGGGQPSLPLDSSPLPGQTPSDTGRDWMRAFISARDGQFVPPVGNHLTANGHTLYVPGLPGSRPFQGFGRMGGNNFSFNNTSLQQTGIASRTIAGFDQEQTLLRALPGDHQDTDFNGVDDNRSERRLFEVGNSTDFEGTGSFSGTDTQKMTPQTRHRLLSKLLNNTTTSSNTFVVNMTIGRFEVLEDTATGVVRIGGEYDITPGDGQPASLTRRRHVFMIDRSEVGEAFDAGSNTLDYRRLIKHHVSLQ